MARFNLSFLSIFLVLAVLAVSVPVKRDGESPTKALGLESTLSELRGATSLMDGLKPKDDKEETPKPEATPSDAEREAAAVEAQASKKVEEARKTEAAGKPTPTPTPTHSKKLSSGNFVTPTATPTHKATSQPNALGKIPIVGGVLGGSGLDL